MYIINKDVSDFNFFSYKDIDYFFILKDKINEEKLHNNVKDYIEKNDMNFLKKLNFRFILIMYFKNTEEIKIICESKGFSTIYYSIVKNKLYLSEDLNDFNKYKKKDLKSISKYLRFGYVPEEYTLLEDVYRVKALNVLIYKKEKNCYQEDFYKIDKIEISNINNAKELLKQYLIDDITETFKTKTPYIMYSGGIDSTVLYYIFEKCDLKPYTFSISFLDKNSDESRFRSHIDAKRNINFDLSCQDYFDYVKESISSNKKGLMRCTQDVWAFSLALNKMGVENKDIIFGLGGDEFFYGYDYMVKAFLIKKNIEYLENCKKEANLTGLSEIVYSEYKDFIDDFRNIIPEYFSDKECIDLTGKYPDFNLKMPEKKDDFFKSVIFCQLKEQLLNNHYLRLRSIEELTNNTVHVPFGNIKIYEFALSLFPECVFYNNKKKYILYELFKDDIPDINYKREKKGFSIPFCSWMDNNSQFIDSCINSSEIPFRKVLHSISKDNLYYQKKWLAFSLSLFSHK